MLKNNVDVYMRCGIAVGNIIGSVIDGRSFRLFGSTINKAARLEGICEKNNICFDKIFYNSLIQSKWFKDCNENNENNEKLKMKNKIYSKSVILKGFLKEEIIYYYDYNNYFIEA